jgi:hypothetical protein
LARSLILNARFGRDSDNASWKDFSNLVQAILTAELLKASLLLLFQLNRAGEVTRLLLIPSKAL